MTAIWRALCASLKRGSEGGAPSGGPGAQPLVRGSGGEDPLKLKHLAFGRSMEAANLPTFLKFGDPKRHRYLCCLRKKMKFT